MANDQQNKMIAEDQAKDCDSHNKKAPISPPEVASGQVFLPVTRAVLSEPPTEEDLSWVGSCRNCLFFITPADMRKEHDIGAGACARKGKIVIPEKTVREAELCEDKMPSLERKSKVDVEKYRASELKFAVAYGNALDHDDSILGRWKRARSSFVDPGDWPTDNPVSAREQAAGIKSWRLIEDPNSKNSVFVPVFDVDFFEESEKNKVPSTGDTEAPEDYIDSEDYVYSSFVEMLLLNETPALWGPAGVGKTELARHLAWIMQVPFDRVSVTNSTEVDHIAGQMLFVDGETKFFPGRIPQRWSRPGVLLLDEPNAGPPDVWQFIRPLTDNSKQLVLDMSGHAVVIDRDPHCFLMMAMNPTWDFRNTGLNEVADADTNRLAHIFMDYPSRDIEAQILANACTRDGWEPGKATIEKVLDVSDDVRRMSEEGSLSVTWGIRSNLKAIRHMRYFSPTIAYRRAITDYLEPDIAQMVLKLVEMKDLS